MTNNENVKKILKAGVLPKRHSKDEAKNLIIDLLCDFGAKNCTLRNCHSEGISPKNPLHILKRFFAKYKFPFAGNCVRPSQNDGKILVSLIQDPTPKSKISTLSHTARSFTRLASSSVQLVPQGAGIKLPSSCSARGEGHNNVKHLFTYSLINLFTPKKNAAFTLAEVLITLGVIGVVAALTIPGLMTAHKKHVTAAKLKRAVSEINQAIRLSENENGQVENWDKSLPDEEFVNTYFRPYIKIMQLCKTPTECGYNSDSPWYYMNGGQGVYNSPNNVGRVSFLSMDGILYTYAKNTDSETIMQDNDKTIIIDINGEQKPNQFGRDIFFFYRDEDADSILPYGHNLSRAVINSSCSKTGDGLRCAVLVKENGWEFPNNYPW